MFVFMLDDEKPVDDPGDDDTTDNEENIPDDDEPINDSEDGGAIDINEEKSSYDQPDDDESNDNNSGAQSAVDKSEKSCEDEMKHGCSTLKSRGFCERFSVIRDKHCRKTCKTCPGN